MGFFGAGSLELDEELEDSWLLLEDSAESFAFGVSSFVFFFGFFGVSFFSGVFPFFAFSFSFSLPFFRLLLLLLPLLLLLLWVFCALVLLAKVQRDRPLAQGFVLEHQSRPSDHRLHGPLL